MGESLIGEAMENSGEKIFITFPPLWNQKGFFSRGKCFSFEKGFRGGPPDFSERVPIERGLFFKTPPISWGPKPGVLKPGGDG